MKIRVMAVLVLVGSVFGATYVRPIIFTQQSLKKYKNELRKEHDFSVQQESADIGELKKVGGVWPPAQGRTEMTLPQALLNSSATISNRYAHNLATDISIVEFLEEAAYRIEHLLQENERQWRRIRTLESRPMALGKRRSRRRRA